MNEMIMWLVILCLFLALGAIIILIVDTIVLRKTDSKLNKFNEWYEEQEKNKEIEKQKVIEAFEKWYKETKDD